MTRFEVINDYIKKRGYKSYLEIGVENPENCFNHIICDYKVSVDPYTGSKYIPKHLLEQFAKQVTFRLTSDEFFEQNNEKFDIIFIDGLHTEEQSTKDVISSLKCLNPYGCVVLHDSLPENERIQSDEVHENGEPWTGTVWKTVKKIIDSDLFKVKVYYHDFGVAVIEAKDNEDGDVTKALKSLGGYLNKELCYDDFSIINMNLEYSFLNDDFKVSYFTPAYKSKYLHHVYESLKAQTDPRWEWVILDDSPPDYYDVWNIVRQWLDDHRIKYFSIAPNSGGFIGRVKNRAVSLCEGVLVAELDHDDEIHEDTTKILLKLHNILNADFYYSDSYSYTLNKNGRCEVVDYPDGFAMGYGSYKEDEIYIRWLNKRFIDRYVVSTNVNPKTIRHIVGVANHIRVWKRSFINKIGNYNVNLPHCDDYELIVRTFINGGKMVKIDKVLYYQYMHNDNSQYKRLRDIQTYVKAISNHYHVEIATKFQEHFGKPNEKIKLFDYVYEYNWKDCNMVGYVEPPSELINMSYNSVISKEAIEFLINEKDWRKIAATKLDQTIEIPDLKS